jgi:ABC-type antimicrobial peptide transport system permease subunit
LRNVIPVGTVLSSYKRIKVNNRFQKEKIKFKVIGILKKDSKWLEDINIEVMNSVIDLDNKFVAIQPYNSEDNMGRCLCTLKGDNAKKIFNKDVMKSARDNKLLVKANTVKEEVSNTIKSDIKELKVYIVFAVFIILVSILAISSISTVSLLLRKRDYGIMYANGMSMQDVRKIVITENIVKILVSFILSQLYILYDLFMNYSGRNEIGLSNLLYIQSKVTVYQMIGIASIVLIISVIVPLYMINRLKITEMIGAND